MLKGTQHPLSLALAFWCRIRFRDIPVASSKMKWTSEISAFARRSCSAKSKRKIHVSTPSKKKVCDFLIRGRHKSLSTKVSALAKNFLFIFLLSVSFGTLDFEKVHTLEVPTLQLTGYSNFCCTQKQEPRNAAACHDKWFLTGRVTPVMSRKPFSDAKMSLLCFQIVRFRDRSLILPWKFATWCLFTLCMFFFRQRY